MNAFYADCTAFSLQSTTLFSISRDRIFLEGYCWIVKNLQLFRKVRTVFRRHWTKSINPKDQGNKPNSIFLNIIFWTPSFVSRILTR